MNIHLSPIAPLSRGALCVFYAECTSPVSVDAILRLQSDMEATCLSCEGSDFRGKDFVKPIHIKANASKRLWCVLRVPIDAEIGEHSLQVSVTDGQDSMLTSLVMSVTVTDAPTVSDPFRNANSLNRLTWLNSTRGIDHTVPAPFVPMERHGNTLRLLGRELVIDSLGFPAQINSYFSKSILITDTPTPILSSPIDFSVADQRFSNRSLAFLDEAEGITVSAQNESDAFHMDVRARAEFDGCIEYRVTLTAKKDVSTKDVSLTLPVSRDCTNYFMGLGKRGGTFDRALDWKWDTALDQDRFWTGDVNAGLQVFLYGDDYVKPPVNIYYAQKPLVAPKSWDNNGQGGIRFDTRSNRFCSYSGTRTMRAGESITYCFRLIITPLKEIDLEKQFGMRIFQAPPAQTIRFEDKKNANIVNIHHGNDLNPYINYPFFELDALADFVKRAHECDTAVKVYYTIRELTVQLPEFEALRDLDYEIFERDKLQSEHHFWQGEAKQWIAENIGTDVIPAWRQELNGEKYRSHYDASILTNGQSRLCNFYVEGLQYLLERTEIDGLYIDDLAYDRHTMKRVRRVLEQRPRPYIDFHTWNHFNQRAAYASSLNLYMELLPYIDKLWIGEGFNYNMPRDYWLVEISGIPFGLMSELMCHGNMWRGLAFGMTLRLGWVKDEDPSSLWEIFDRYHLEKCEMYGFWNESNPAKTDNDSVIVTTYRKEERLFLALANMTANDQQLTLTFDDIPAPTLFAPEIQGFQTSATYGTTLTVTGGKGLFLCVK